MEKMNKMEIHERIKFLNKQIEKCLKPNEFTLNNLVVELSKEIDELQKQCEHEFEEGYCIYCFKEGNN